MHIDKEVMGYFRAIFTAKEISERALELTKETIELNQGNYTAWHFRRQLLHELKKDLTQEVMWLNAIGVEMQKNYQIWHHRRCIFEMWIRKGGSKGKEQEEAKVQESTASLGESKVNCKDAFDAELWFLDTIFESDSKNYHAWSHKIWLIERYEMWSDSRHMAFAEEMLDKDVRNNSVWSFRYFLIMRSTPFSKELVERECKYVLEKRLPDDWRNEAAWAYMRGMLATTKEEAEKSMSSNAKRWFIGELEIRTLLEKWGNQAQSAEFSNDMVETGDGVDQDEAVSKANMRYEGLKKNRFLFATLADFAIASGDKDKAIFYLDELKKFDAIRHKFWEWRKTRVGKLL